MSIMTYIEKDDEMVSPFNKFLMLEPISLAQFQTIISLTSIHIQHAWEILHAQHMASPSHSLHFQVILILLVHFATLLRQAPIQVCIVRVMCVRVLSRHVL